MRPITVSQTGTGSTAVVPMDLYQSPFAVGLGLKVTGTVTCKVEHTFDDPFAAGFSAASATWYTHSTISAATANADGNYAFPVRAIRLTVTAGTGTGTLTIIQSNGATS